MLNLDDYTTPYNFGTWRRTTAITQIILHCDWAYRPPEAPQVNIAEINHWHLKRGWSGVGYHWFIKRDGTIEKGRPEGRWGAHTKGQNSNSIGICMSGGRDADGEDEDNFTGEQMQAQAELVYALMQRYPTIKTIRGHNDFSPKTCPVYSVTEFLEDYLQPYIKSEEDTLPVDPEPNEPLIPGLDSAWTLSMHDNSSGRKPGAIKYNGIEYVPMIPK